MSGHLEQELYIFQERAPVMLLTVGHWMIMDMEIPVIWLLLNLANHKVGHTQEQFIVIWKWYILDEACIASKSRSRASGPTLPTSLITVSTVLSCPYIAIAIWKVLWDPAERGRKSPHFVYRLVSLVNWCKLEMGSICIKRQWREKIFPMDKVIINASGHPLLWKERWPEMRSYAIFWEVANNKPAARERSRRAD